MGELGRREELPPEPLLPRPLARPSPLDAHDLPHGPLPAPRVGDARPRPRALGDEPGRLPRDEPPPPRGERGARLRPLPRPPPPRDPGGAPRSEEHTSELQSLRHLVCRL